MSADPNDPRAAVDAGVTALIEALRRRLGNGPIKTSLPGNLDEHVRQLSPEENLPAKFSEAATGVGLHVHPASASAWMDVICDVLRDAAARSVVVNMSPNSPLGAQVQPELLKRLAADGVEAVTELDDATLFAVDAGVTTVAAAIAETGSLVCTSGPGLARGTSLIPPIHVAVVHAAQLVPDLCDYLGGLGSAANLPANINLITGPSKTSDIEGILVTGVHGPGHVHVVLVAP
jgi:L-lactate dehydrogenase complex protein LldG